mgnify:CR=1 FL=1
MIATTRTSVTESVDLEDQVTTWNSTETPMGDEKRSPTFRKGIVIPAFVLCATLTTPFSHNDSALELQQSGASSTFTDFDLLAPTILKAHLVTRVSRQEARALALNSAAKVRHRVVKSRAKEAQLLRELYDTEDV